MTVAYEMIEEFSVPSKVHLGEKVYVAIRKEQLHPSSSRFTIAYRVDLHVGSYRLAQNYSGLTRRGAGEIALRYLLKHVDGLVPQRH